MGWTEWYFRIGSLDLWSLQINLIFDEINLSDGPVHAVDSIIAKTPKEVGL